MKKLTVKGMKHHISNQGDFIYIENKFKILLPEEFKSLVSEYEDCSTEQSVYHRVESGRFYQLCQFLSIKGENKASIEAIFKGHLYYGDIGYVPFATDAGGWDFNISIKPETYGQIWIDKFDSGEEDPFEFVCESLEKFIDSLITFEEAILLGY